MKACPLEFSHPSEAQQLSGLGPKMCERLTAKLKEHCEKHGLPMPERQQPRQQGELLGTLTGLYANNTNNILCSQETTICRPFAAGGRPSAETTQENKAICANAAFGALCTPLGPCYRGSELVSRLDQRPAYRSCPAACRCLLYCTRGPQQVSHCLGFNEDSS